MNEKILKKMIQILENMQSEIKAHGKYRFSPETKGLISEVAEYCRKTKIYNLAKKKDEPEFIRTEPAEHLYSHMINKMAKASRARFLFCIGAVVIMMPAIDDAIKGGRVDDN